MKETTVEITKNCPFADECDYCSTDSKIDGDHLDLIDIKKFIDKFGNADIINISGGEPLMHPNIGEIILYALKKTNEVCLQSNLARWIRYNTDIVRDIKVDANVCVIAGRERYLPKPIIKVKTHLLKLVHQGRAENLPKQNITVSKNFCGCDDCEKCNHVAYLRADGTIVKTPCKKYS